MNVISRKEAQELKIVKFFTGVKCVNNHLDYRYTKTGVCYSCKRVNMSNDYIRNNERIKKSNSKYYQENKPARIIKSKKWAIKNRGKSNSIKAKYKLNNIEKVRIAARIYQKKARLIDSVRLSKNLSKAIWECLKSKKNKQSWKNLVSFSLDDLIIHLENKFNDKMNWKNYGIFWHLDHIKPLSWFKMEDEFEKAWNINNLQPLEAKINLSKGNRYEG